MYMNYKDFFKEDMIPGGKGDTAAPSNFDPNELAIGIKVESEHTQDERLAKEIAMDHLTEDPHYYSRLNQAGLVDEPMGNDGNVVNEPITTTVVSTSNAIVEPNTQDVETKTVPGTVYPEVEDSKEKTGCAGQVNDAGVDGKTDVDSPPADPTPTDHVTGGMGGTPENPNILPKCGCGSNGDDEGESLMPQSFVVGITEGKKTIKRMWKSKIEDDDNDEYAKPAKKKKMTKEQWAGDPDNDKAYVKGKRWTVKGK